MGNWQDTDERHDPPPKEGPRYQILDDEDQRLSRRKRPADVRYDPEPDIEYAQSESSELTPWKVIKWLLRPRWWNAGVLLLAIVVHWAFGPRARLPAIDPVERINAEVRGLPVNGAARYREALEAYRPAQDGFAPDDLHRIDDADFRAQLATHLADNADCLIRLDAAGRVPACLFEVHRRADGLIEIPDLLKLRELGRLLNRRLALAVAERDLDAFERIQGMLQRFAGHLFGQDLAVAHLIGMAAATSGQDKLLEPFTWEHLSPSDRIAYAERIENLCIPPPSLSRAVRMTRDELIWVVHRRSLAERMAGEIDHYITPLAMFVEMPIERQAAAGGTERAAMLRIWDHAPHRSQSLRIVASRGIPLFHSMLTAAEFRICLIAMQRGNLTAVRILAQRESRGALPPDLDEFGTVALDVFTGKPLVYHPNLEGDFVLYSRGFNGDDDGGLHKDMFGRPQVSEQRESGTPLAPEGDYLFWPLEQRRAAQLEARLSRP